MRHVSAGTLAVLLGVIAVIAPIVTSIRLAWREALAYESSVSLSYGEDVLRRAEETGSQMAAGIRLINDAHEAPCSEPELAIMRKVDVGSSYIQAVGRINGEEIACNSVGGVSPISLGAPILTTERGAHEWLNVMLPLADSPVTVFALQGVAFILDPTLVLDVPTEGPNISIATFVPSSANHTIFSARGLRPHAVRFRTILKGSNLTFRDAGYIVTIARAANIDIAVITSARESYMLSRVRRFAYIFIPFGLLSAAGLAWAVTIISRLYLSMPSVFRGR
ncbi:MAG: CSS-motif domain-containing protein [Acidobacteriota bacterium]